MAPSFAVEQLLGVFRDHNMAVWPAQWLFVGLAMAALVAAIMVDAALLATANRPLRALKP